MLNSYWERRKCITLNNSSGELVSHSPWSTRGQLDLIHDGASLIGFNSNNSGEPSYSLLTSVETIPDVIHEGVQNVVEAVGGPGVVAALVVRGDDDRLESAVLGV